MVTALLEHLTSIKVFFYQVVTYSSAMLVNVVHYSYHNG